MKIQNREELERQDAFGIGAPPPTTPMPGILPGIPS